MISLVTLGLPDAVTYFIARGDGGRARLISVSLVTLAICGALSSAVMYALSPVLANGDENLSELIRLAILALVPSLIVAGLRGVAAGSHRWAVVTSERILIAGTRLLGVALLAWSDALTPTSAAIVIAGSGVVGGFSYVALIFRKSPYTGSEHRTSIPSLYAFGAHMWVGSITGILVSRLDQVLMVPLSSTYELGLYAVAVSVSELPLIINSAVRDVMFSSDSAKNDSARLAAATRISTALTTAAGIGVGALSVAFLPILFGSDFKGAVLPTVILIAAVIAGNPGSISGVGLTARGRPGLRSLALFIALIVNVVAVLILVPRMGATGAAIATLAGNSTAAASNLLFFKAYFGQPPSSFLGLERQDLRLVRKHLWRRFHDR
jgi:O-antigen/teichoic acid export membrane protein